MSKFIVVVVVVIVFLFCFFLFCFFLGGLCVCGVFKILNAMF